METNHFLLSLFGYTQLIASNDNTSASSKFQVGIRSITREGREQGKRFGVEQYEMRTFSRDRHILENLVNFSNTELVTSLQIGNFVFCLSKSSSSFLNKLV